ncbi:hypothetical protein TL16_g06483 [Triparma laevis f. inornata]|uniref:Uncharacterized protein n=1 Tax=Triparma laevis f. inornata TaxID=1714386 RepID=A0A9W7EFD5_9STRA|nr:hypothetical protein TL16_g06483 [Triparma laevis f. inornata]
MGFVDPPSDDEGEKKVSGVRRQSSIAKQRAKRQSIKQQKDALGKLGKKRSEAGGQTGEVYRREAFVNAHGGGSISRSACVCINYSDCGRYLATAGEDKQIHIYAAQSLRPMFDTGGLQVTSDVLSLDFNPDGKILAAGLKDGRVVIWHLDFFGGDTDEGQGVSGTVKYSRSENLKKHERAVNSVCFSTNGEFLATGGDDHKIVLWHMDRAHDDDRKPVVLEATVDASKKFDETRESRATSAASKMVCGVGGLGSKVGGKLTGLMKGRSNSSNLSGAKGGKGEFEIEEDQEVFEFEKEDAWTMEHSEPITCLSWSPDDRFLASGGEDNTVRIWNFSKKGEVEAMVLYGHTSDVLDVSFSPDGDHLVSVGGQTLTSSGNEIRIWDMKGEDLGDEEMCSLFTGHNLGVSCCSWSEDSKTICTGSYDKTIRFWSMDSEKCVRVIKTDGEVRTLSGGKNRKFIAIGDSLGQVKKYHFTYPVEGFEKELAKAFQFGGLDMENLIKDMVEDDERKPLADGGIYLVTEYLLHNEEGDSLTLFFNTIWNVLLEWDEEQTDTDEQVAKDAQDKFVKLDAATAMFFKHVEKFKPDILEVLSENLEGDEIQKVAETEMMLLIMDMFGRGGVWGIYYSEIVIYTVYMLCFVTTTISFKYARVDLTMDERITMQIGEYVLIITSFYFFIRELYQNYNEYIKDSGYKDFFLWIEKNKLLNVVLWMLGLTAMYYFVIGTGGGESKESNFMTFVVCITTWASVFMFSVLGWWASTDILSPAGSIAMLLYFVRYGPGDDFNHIASGVALINWVKFLNVIRGLSKEIATFVLMIEFILADLSSFMIVQMLMMVMFGHAFYLELSTVDMPFHDENDTNPFATKWDTIQTLIKTLFGDFDSSIYKYNYVKAIFFLYMFIIIIVMLNVLIAIVSDSYAKAMEQSNQIYCRSRLELIVEMRTTFGAALSCFPTVERLGRLMGKNTPRFIQEKIKRNKKGVEMELNIPPTSIWDDRIEEIVAKVGKKVVELKKEEEGVKFKFNRELNTFISEQKEVNKELKQANVKMTMANTKLQASNKELLEKVDVLVEMINGMAKGDSEYNQIKNRIKEKKHRYTI